MNFSISDHLLKGDNIRQQLTDKHSGEFASGLPDTIIMHYTAGSSLDGAVNHLSKPSVQASAHLVVDRDGSIVQLVEFNKKAWHAGRSQYQDRKGLNQYSIGIEMVNAGPLNPSGDGFISAFGKHYPADAAVQATHRNEQQPRYWQAYTEAQINCVSDICEALRDHYQIASILGHEEIAPLRKKDPGPAFPLDSMRQQLLENRGEDGADEIIESGIAGVVTASMLNFRDAPSTSGKLIHEPLTQGTQVDILQEQNGWYQVRLKETGWVSKKYIDTARA